MNNITVIKIGGVALSTGDTTIEDAVTLQKRGEPLVIVHGGGNLVTEWLRKQGVASKFVRGERVTDRASLDVVIAVLAGLANKQIVARINASGGRAVGISGVDGCLVQARVKNAELGYVGDVDGVEPAAVNTLLEAGYLPVISPVCFNPTDDPHIVNVNGDPVAGEIARALGAARLVFLTDVAGILDSSGSLIARLSRAEAGALIVSGVASGGMIPKINACLRTEKGVTRIIDGRQPHALLREVEGAGSGTTIV